mgnify:CR=1 FL=1
MRPAKTRKMGWYIKGAKNIMASAPSSSYVFLLASFAIVNVVISNPAISPNDCKAYAQNSCANILIMAFDRANIIVRMTGIIHAVFLALAMRQHIAAIIISKVAAIA